MSLPLGAASPSNRPPLPTGETGDASETVDAGGPLPVAGLLLDVGGLLFDDTLWPRWLWRVLGRLDIHPPFAAFYRCWESDFLARAHVGACSFEEALEGFLNTTGLSPPQISEIVAASTAQRREFEEHARPLPGVRSTLSRLALGPLALGICTNAACTAEQLAERLLPLDLAPRWTAMLTSRDLGCRMTDPQAYPAALAALGLSAGEVALVGHDAAELAAARAAGMFAIACNHEAGTQADRYLDRFDDLLGICPLPARLAVAG